MITTKSDHLFVRFLLMSELKYHLHRDGFPESSSKGPLWYHFSLFFFKFQIIFISLQHLSRLLTILIGLNHHAMLPSIMMGSHCWELPQICTFQHIISLNSCNRSLGWVLLLSPFYGWGHWDSNILGDSPKNIELQYSAYAILTFSFQKISCLKGHTNSKSKNCISNSGLVSLASVLP